MLGKLIKHEFKATWMQFFLLYGALLVLSIVNKLFWLINSENVILNIIRGIIMIAYVLMIIAVSVITVILIVYRFYKNLLKDEGYLSFTLPVKVSHHINSKLIVSFIWLIITSIITILAIVIMSLSGEFFDGVNYIAYQLSYLFANYDGLIRLSIELILFVIVCSFYMILMMYASLSLGQLFAKHKIAGAVLSFFGFYVIMQILNSIIIYVVMRTNITMLDAVSYNNDITTAQVIPIINNLILCEIVIQVVISVVYYFITKIILSKKLNLE